MPTATAPLPDLSPEQLAELSDRMKVAKQKRHDRERAEQGKAGLRRRAQSRLQKVAAEIAPLKNDLTTKRQVVSELEERRDQLAKLPPSDSAARAEVAALKQALAWATEEGINVTAGVHVPSNHRAVQLLAHASPHGTNWRTPVAVLEAQMEELIEERDKLTAELETLDDGA